jgi:hypothetical protein
MNSEIFEPEPVTSEEWRKATIPPKNERVVPLVIPASANFLAPTIVDDLVRIGKPNDGGYLIPKSAVLDTDFVISLGLSEDWSFDEQFKKLNPRIHIHAYDHSVSRKLFRRYLFGVTKRFCKGRVSLDEVKKRFRVCRAYNAFFRGTVKHFEEHVSDRVELPFEVTLDRVFERVNSSNIFLKVDIECAEYRIMNDILKFANRIVAMAIEFHNTGPLRSVFCASVKKLQERFEIVHLHANNFGGVASDGLPEALEITFLKRSKCEGGQKRMVLPISLLDSPCNPGAPEYRLTFPI